MGFMPPKIKDKIERNLLRNVLLRLISKAKIRYVQLTFMFCVSDKLKVKRAGQGVRK